MSDDCVQLLFFCGVVVLCDVFGPFSLCLFVCVFLWMFAGGWIRSSSELVHASAWHGVDGCPIEMLLMRIVVIE